LPDAEKPCYLACTDCSTILKGPNKTGTGSRSRSKNLGDERNAGVPVSVLFGPLKEDADAWAK
jgi:hypothetical protein